MAVFKFHCPSCGKKLEAERDWVGMETECAWCGKSFAIPAAPSDGAADHAPKANPPRVSFGTRKAPPPPAPAPEKRVICPVCRRQYTLDQAGEYPCVCGTIIELADGGAIHVFMKLKRYGVWTGVVKWLLVLVAPLAIALFLMLVG